MHSVPPIQGVNHTFMDIDGSEQAWFAGLMASDGCIQGSKRFRLVLAENDWELLERCKSLVAPYNRLCLYGMQPYLVQRIKALTVNSKPLVDALERWGVVPRKTLVYTLPSMEGGLLPSYLRGYIDGDGCIGGYLVGGSINYLQISITSANMSFIDELAFRVPMKSSIYRRKHPGKGGVIYWSGRHAIDFGRWIYSDGGLINSRKQREFLRLEALASTTTRYGIFGPKREEAKHLYTAGLPIIAIAERLEVCKAVVFKWRNQYNWEDKPCLVS